MKPAGSGDSAGEIAATIAESDAFYHLDAPVCRLAGRDVPIPYNKTLESEIVPTQSRIVEAARSLLA